MKYIARFLVLIVTWPVLLLVISIMGIAWLCAYSWGSNGRYSLKDSMKEEIIAAAYCLWHFRCKEDKQ